MQTIEVKAKTSEEAIEIALKELDVERNEVEINVVNQGKSGLLGIGGESAVVKVTRLDKASDLVRTATNILENLISKMGVSVTINLKSAYQDDVGGPVFEINGDDAGLLIGRRGETLRALQVLVNSIAGRQLESKVYIFLDVAGYQKRRKQALTSLARRVGQRVVASGRAITLEPMPPNERRIVHMVLADYVGVRTVSMGVDEGRQITVEPAEE